VHLGYLSPNPYRPSILYSPERAQIEAARINIYIVPAATVPNQTAADRTFVKRLKREIYYIVC
jgi:hypothetical protein